MGAGPNPRSMVSNEPAGAAVSPRRSRESSTPPVRAAEPTPEFRCTMPPVPIARPGACDRGQGYPRCKWRMPPTRESGGHYRRWRNTIPAHAWGRPALVSVLLATARAFHERHPEQQLLIGDLDAPGPRHQTHKTGIDNDLYLPGALLVDTLGGGRLRRNYRHMSAEEVTLARERVLDLAKILATCTNGRIRIYYNDTEVRDRFHAWFDARGYETPYGRPMQRHNELHDFHFHLSITEDAEVLPFETPYEGRHPRMRIDIPPEIEGVTVFPAIDSSNTAMTAMTGGASMTASPSDGASTTMGMGGERRPEDQGRVDD